MKSLGMLIAFHELKADVGLMVLTPDVAERVSAELGWVEGCDFKTADPQPITRDYLFVRSKG